MVECASEVLLGNKMNATFLVDPGFFEGDIKASIEDAAQGHIKWIYDCLMARNGHEASLRMSQLDRQMVLERSVLIYKGYVKKILLKNIKKKPWNSSI